MSNPESLYRPSLTGYTILRETPRDDITLGDQVYEQADHYTERGSYRSYLELPAYDKYLSIHKVLVGESGAKELLALADDMSQSALPKHLDAAGSAYCEAALALHGETATNRIALAEQAVQCWERSLLTSQVIAENESVDILYGDSDQFRTALNIAYAPLLISMMLGNVTRETMKRTTADTLAIAQTSAVQKNLARQRNSRLAADDHVGLLHECNALLTLLHFKDPKYVPAPSFERADNGIYHRRQSHDIMIFHQHYGDIKKIVPIEVKATASKSDRARYKALLVRGKMHLISNHGFDPVETLDAFTNTFHGTATQKDAQLTDFASANMKELLRLYKRGKTNTAIKTTSPTKFHDPTYVADRYVSKK